MNVQDMTNAEIYERVLQLLIEHLGIEGTTRFLSICKPRKNQTLVVEQQLPRSVMESIQERIYGTYAAQQYVPNNENIRNLDKLSDTAFYEHGLKIISDGLGPVGMARFIRMRKPNAIDYTAERHKWLDNLDSNAILEGIQQAQKEMKMEDARDSE